MPIALALAAAAAVVPVAASSAAPRASVTIDLTRPFETRTPWRLTATQGAPIPDPILGEGKAPAVVRLCLGHPQGGACRPDLSRLLVPPGGADAYAEAHELLDARIVRPRARAPLLLLRVGSLRGVNGDQRIATALLAYDRASDRFVPVFIKRTGRNNNQEVRYVATGPLAGNVVSAEPTSDAPFAYWITVSAPADGAQPYRQLLGYRSGVRYGDGDPRAVIDAEMPAILRRLHRP